MDIPIELFAIFLGVSLTFLGIGLSKKVGVAILISGMFILTTAVLTDNIIMGSQVTESTFNNSTNTTSYQYELAIFQFTEYHKIIMALVGITFMLIGVLYFRD